MTKPKKEFQIDGTANLLATVPHLLGFNPENSLVIVAVKGEQDQVVVTMTIDLPEKIDEDFTQNLCETIKRSGADGLVAIFYLQVKPNIYKELAELFMERISLQFHIRDILWVSSKKWASFLCSDERCCPAEGRILEVDSSLGLKSELSLVSNPASKSKNDLEQYLRVTKVDQTLIPFISKLAKQKAKSNHDEKMAKWGRTQFTYLSQRKAFNEYDEKTWARLLVGLSDIPVRDALMCHHIEIAQVSEDANRYLIKVAQNWAKVAQVAPESFRAPICSCVAALMWQAGEGILARIAVDFALVADPQFHLAKLLNNALNSGMPPWEFRDAFTKITNPWS
jgi:hypothetical protein